MFTLEGKLTFINIDQNYLKKLHDVCSEVYYKPSGSELYYTRNLPIDEQLKI